MTKIIHCQKCSKTGKACQKYHLYVIELKSSVWKKEKNFRKKNPHLKDDYNGKCYYVGLTKHRPECRYKQHVAPSARRNNPKCGFMCNCFKNETVKRYFNKRRSANFVGDYHEKGGLRPKLYAKGNPITGSVKEAKKAEAVLAQSLREQGFAVHSA